MQTVRSLDVMSVVTKGINALSLSSNASKVQHPLLALVKILESIPGCPEGARALFGKPLLTLSGTEEPFTEKLWNELTGNGTQVPAFCSFFLQRPGENVGREVVMREADFNTQYHTIKDQIRAPPQKIFDYTEASIKIERLAREHASRLSGEELLLVLACIHLVPLMTALSTPHLMQTLIEIAPHFFSGAHETLYNSLYGELEWFSTIKNNLKTPREHYYFSLRHCVSTIHDELLRKEKQGLYTQMTYTSTPHHPSQLTQTLTRFHDWYALCFKLAGLINEKMLFHCLLKMPKSDTETIHTLLSMFSILDVLASKGTSDDFYHTISQPHMSFQKWQSTRYFSFFCFKVLLYYPTHAICPLENTPLLAVNILQGLCLSAPFCLHEYKYLLPESHFSHSSSPKKKDDGSKNMVEICRQTVAARHQKAFTLVEFLSLTRICVSRFSSEQYLKMCIEACSSTPLLEKNFIYNLCILSLLQAKTPAPDMTIEKWKSSDSFMQFCLQFLQSIQDPVFLVKVLTIYKSDPDITRNIPITVKFLKNLKRKKIDIDFLLVSLSNNQFKDLSNSAEYEVTLLFPAVLRNVTIASKELYHSFYRGLCLLLGTQVPFSFIKHSLDELVNFRARLIDDEFWYADFDNHVRTLLHTTWSLRLEHASEIPQLRTLYTQEDFKKKIVPLIEKAASLAPGITAYIHTIFVEKIIDFLCSIKPQQRTETLLTLKHIQTHFYPIILHLLGAIDPKERQNQANRLSYNFFCPLVFPQEFSVAVVRAAGVAYTDIIEKTMENDVQLLATLASSLVEERDRRLHEDLVRKQIIECFIDEIKAIAETPRKQKYDETACTERIAAKNAILTLIQALFGHIQDEEIKKLCFQQIGKLKSEEHQISPQRSPREFLVEPSSTEHKHSFSIKQTGLKIIFEILR